MKAEAKELLLGFCDMVEGSDLRVVSGHFYKTGCYCLAGAAHKVSGSQDDTLVWLKDQLGEDLEWHMDLVTYFDVWAAAQGGELFKDIIPEFRKFLHSRQIDE